jgi:hypothetical protein
MESGKLTMCRLRIGGLALGLIFLTCVAGPAVLAQTSADSSSQPSPAQLEKRVADLEKQLETLRGELATLKAKDTGAPAAAVPAGVASQAVATSTPAPSDPLSGISSVIGGSTFSGLVDGYYSYDANQPANHVAGDHFFDNSTNQFALNLIELGLVKTPDANSRLGYDFTLGFGNAMAVVNSGDPTFLQYVKEAYMSYLAPAGKGLQIDFGKFVTPAGAEVIETNQNWNYSRSLLFYDAIPYYHFGLRLKYTFNDKWSVTGYVVNGWNNVLATNSGKTGGLGVAWTPTKKVSISETWLGGPGALPVDSGSWRNLSDTVLTYNVNSKLSLMLNGDYGRVEKALGFVNPAEYYGTAGYIKYQFNPKWAIATRYEYLNDPEGLATGGYTAVTSSLPALFTATPGHVQEATGTVERRIAQHLITRLEYRHDMSTQPLFLKGNSPGFAPNVMGQSTVTAGMVFVWEPPR